MGLESIRDIIDPPQDSRVIIGNSHDRLWASLDDVWRGDIWGRLLVISDTM